MNITNETTTERRMNQQHYQRKPAPMFERVPRTYVHEDTVAVQTVEIERKKFTIKRCTNPRGELLRITEEPLEGGHYNSIIIPVTGMLEFLKALSLVCQRDAGPNHSK